MATSAARHTDESELLSPTRGAAGEAAAAAAAAALDARGDGAAGARRVPGTWEGVCEWVLGRRLSLWDAVFEAAFMQVSRCDFISSSMSCYETKICRCAEEQNMLNSAPGSNRHSSFFV